MTVGDEPGRGSGEDPGARIDRVRGELAALTREAQDLAAGDDGPGADIVPARSADPIVAKRQMATLRSRAKRQQALISGKRAELEALMRAELALADAVLGPIQAIVKRLEENILTVNLYLGVDEEIVLLRDGASAPADTPITLRQSLLFMDEECTAFAEEGGISPVEIDAFDAWLLEDPRHLDQVLPEPKGIVALRPRRHLGRHGEGHDAAELAEENRRTYWLVRNGERVYRTLTRLEIRTDRVLPVADEFERIFTRAGGRGARVPLKPGSYEWERAQEHAEDRERTFLRVGLLLEGLLHRTPIFHPLADAGVSFLSPLDVREGRVRYINDAEGLGMGEESFEDWRARLMGELRVGMRVLLGPGLRDANESGRRGHSRLSPRNANLPDYDILYIIEEAAGDELVFRYHEGERWVGEGAWGGGELREPKRRASCTIRRSDEFVLPFDLADPDDMRRFLQRRGDRHHYAAMFPVIKAAIAAKRRETDVEAPFITMLAGVLARDNAVSVADAHEQIPDLVWWWKTKNRYHRPLLLQAMSPAVDDGENDDGSASGRRSAAAMGMRGRAAQREAQADEAAQRRAGERARRDADEQTSRSELAVRMIVAEHARRLADARRPINQAVVAALRAAHPVRLLIARPRRAGYIVLTPAEGAKDVYVHQHEYSARGDLLATREWVLPRSRSVRAWVTVETSERWERWDLHAGEHEHLRGPDEQHITAEALRDFAADPAALALAFDGRRFTMWVAGRDAVVDDARPLTRRPKGPTIKTRTRWWELKAGAVRLCGWRDDAHDGQEFGSHERALPWDALAYRAFDDDEPPQREHNVIARADAAIESLEQQARRYRAARKRADALDARASALVQSVEDAWFEQAWATERRRFDEDFGDPDLWDAHRQSKQRDVRMPRDWTLRERSSYGPRSRLWDAVARLLEAGEDPVGRTVADVLRDATRRSEASCDHEDDTRPVVYTAPQDLHEYVLVATGSDEEHPDDDVDALGGEMCADGPSTTVVRP